MTSYSGHKYHTLDALRGIASLAVVLYHFNPLLPGGISPWFFRSGYLAVDLFFLLSGFVIAFNYDSRLAGSMTFGRFFLLRAIRLLPMVWIGVAIGAGSLLIAGSASDRAILAVAGLNALLLPNFIVPSLRGYATDRPIWSLFFEMVANIIYGLFHRAMKMAVLIGIVLASLVGVFAAAILFGSMDLGSTPGTEWTGVPRVCFSFFLGVIICRTRDKWAARLPVIPVPLLLLATMTLLFVKCPDHLRFAYDLAFVCAASPLLVMLGAVSEPRPQHAAFAVGLGVLSYPLYAIHAPIQNWADLLLKSTGVSRSLIGAGTIVMAILAALLLAKFYDEPIRKKLKAWLHR